MQISFLWRPLYFMLMFSQNPADVIFMIFKNEIEHLEIFITFSKDAKYKTHILLLLLLIVVFYNNIIRNRIDLTV